MKNRNYELLSFYKTGGYRTSGFTTACEGGPDTALFVKLDYTFLDLQTENH